MAGFFGKKDVKVKVQKDYTADEFYEIIKDHPFAAGKPEKIRYMMMDLIVFPALDKHNQVRIGKTGQKTWTVWKDEEAKGESLIANAALPGKDYVFGDKTSEAQFATETITGNKGKPVTVDNVTRPDNQKKKKK